MKLLFKQRFFSWFDSYDIYDESENVVYTVKGQLSWGHCLKVFDRNGNELGTVKERVLTFLPEFEIYDSDHMIGTITREFSFITPRYNIDFCGWHVEGDWMEWDYTIIDNNGNKIADIIKELFHMTDTYILDITDPSNALNVLLFVLAMDAEKCSKD